METKRIKSPEGVTQLMRELWTKHSRGESKSSATIFMVDLPEPTEEEKRIMAFNRANRKPFVISDEDLKTAVENGVGLLGGW